MTNANLPDYGVVPISKLRPDPQNARRHPSVNINVIRHSLKKFGQVKPILVTRDHVVVAGNGTLKAAKALGWKTIRVAYTDLTGADLSAYALVDNQSAMLAEWDIPILSGQLFDLGAAGWDIAALGFGEKQPEADREEERKDKPLKPAEYLVVVECKDEDEQRQVYEELRLGGHACKLL